MAAAGASSSARAASARARRRVTRSVLDRPESRGNLPLRREGELAAANMWQVTRASPWSSPPFVRRACIARARHDAGVWTSIVVVDDASPDRTAADRDGGCRLRRSSSVRHAAQSGSRSCHCHRLRRGARATRRRPRGDGRRRPDGPGDLPRVLEPVIVGRADYVKGNRFRHAAARAYAAASPYWRQAALGLDPNGDGARGRRHAVRLHRPRGAAAAPASARRALASLRLPERPARACWRSTVSGWSRSRCVPCTATRRVG